MSQTNAPTTRPSGPVKDESGIDWDNKDTFNKYLTGPGKNNKQIEGNDKFPETCPNPPPFTMGDVFSKAEDLAKEMGGGEKCVKSAKTFADQQSKSGGKRSDWYSETAVNLDSWLVDMNASHKMGGSNTETNQESSSRMGSDNFQSGCGSLMITANNVAFKQSQMQCSITNNKSTKETSVSSDARIKIESSPLTTADKETLLEMKKDYQKFLTTNNENIQALCVTMTKLMMEEMRTNNEAASKMLAENPASGAKVLTAKEMGREVGLLVIELVKPMQKFLLEQAKLMKNSIDVFQRREINIKRSTLIAKAGSKVSLYDKFEDETVTKMETLSNSIQKDVAAQEIANEMGVSAMDPSVKSMAQNSVDTQQNSASSAIKNTINASKVKMSATGEIILVCPGVINIIDTTIDASAILELVSESIVKQSVANGQSASARAAADSTKENAIQNKVAGLDKLQEKLGSSIADAIKAGNDPINKAIQADVDKTKEREQSFRAALPGGGSNSMIIIGVVVLVALYLLFGGGGGGGGGGGTPIIIQNKMRPFRFQFKK